uniref:BTB/POZ domain-containing protein KCTD9 n=1 Tax=Myxine glutinosa TaxID=7769 RepID=UPI00358F9224
MRRVTLFPNGSNINGKMAWVLGSLSDILTSANKKLGLARATLLYNAHGALVDDITLIQDDDVLYVSEGENFIPPPQHLVTTSSGSDWITLNVGGVSFTTTRSTLVSQAPDSVLAKMFDPNETWDNHRDGRGAVLIDRSPRYFSPVLDFLRHGQLVLDSGISFQGVLEEAKFFGISELVCQLEHLIEVNRPSDDHTPLTRKEFVRFLLSTPTTCELRCQGLNFADADLSRLDLRYINFKMATLHGANLSQCNLASASLERADLTCAILDGANLQGVKMLCANLEGASLKGCNFEEPSGLKANLEGANLKGVDLEGSLMAGVNLRVATLKNANLKRCVLRGATLAGADLENCDLSGCDLQEANLRGSNVKGAIFEEMLTPLHMSQSVR